MKVTLDLEEGAKLAHALWSRWMRHMVKCGFVDVSGCLIVPEHEVIRWHKQMKTPYSMLEVAEQQSDREAFLKCLGKEL